MMFVYKNGIKWFVVDKAVWGEMPEPPELVIPVRDDTLRMSDDFRAMLLDSRRNEESDRLLKQAFGDD